MSLVLEPSCSLQGIDSQRSQCHPDFWHPGACRLICKRGQLCNSPCCSAHPTCIFLGFLSLTLTVLLLAQHRGGLCTCKSCWVAFNCGFILTLCSWVIQVQVIVALCKVATVCMLECLSTKLAQCSSTVGSFIPHQAGSSSCCGHLQASLGRGHR